MPQLKNTEFRQRLDELQDEVWASVEETILGENFKLVDDERKDEFMDALRDYLRHVMRESVAWKDRPTA